MAEAACTLLPGIHPPPASHRSCRMSVFSALCQEPNVSKLHPTFVSAGFTMLIIGNLVLSLQDAHDGSLTSLYFFPGEPLLMSCAADNSLKQWLFDAADGTARLLRFRSGHSAPPSCLKFYGQGNRLLSAGGHFRPCPS